MKNEDKWVESFRERLKDYSEPLPKGLWDKIEIDLYNEKPKVYHCEGIGCRSLLL